MTISKTLLQLRTSLKIRAGIDTTGTSVDLTDAVLNELLNDALYEVYDVVVGKWEDYYTTSGTIAVTASQDTYSLPADYFKLRSVWVQTSTTPTYKRLHPIALDALHQYYGKSTADHNYRYLHMGVTLQLAPVPTQAETLKIYYIPLPTTLVSDADTIAFDTPIELKLMLAIAWRDVLERQDLDSSPAVAKMAEYTAKLKSAADNRDAGEPFYLSERGPSRDDDWDEVL